MRLHDQVKYNKDLVAVLEDGLLDIRRYLNSTKFSQDIMVNKNDILLRISEIQQALHDIHNRQEV